jgi:hypothetical protein
MIVTSDKGTTDIIPLEIIIDDGVDNDDWVGNNQYYIYSINYYNPNPEIVSDILIKNTLPSEVNFIDASPGFNNKDNWVKWFIDEIPSKSGGHLWINVSVDESLDKIIEVVNNIEISINDTFENSTYITTLVGNPEPIIVIKNDDIDGYKITDCANCLINYTIQIENPNIVPVTGIWITDNFPEELNCLDASKDFFVDYDDGWIDWYIESIGPSESLSLWLKTSIKPSVESGEWIVNKVFVDSIETEENKSTSTPLIYKSAKIITFSQWFYKDWNSLFLGDTSVKDNDYSIENIFESVWGDIQIIFEKSSGKNYVKDETGNTLSIIDPKEIYLVKMKNETVFFIGNDPHENRPPVAILNGPFYGKAEKKISLNASQSYDPDADLYDEISGFRWDYLNNGTYSEWFDTPISKFSYDKNGTFIVKLQVKDKFGLNDTDTSKVFIGNQLPIADSGGPYNGFPDEDIAFNASASIDPDGKITGYKWDFDGDGTYDTEWLNNSNIKHIYQTEGEYTAELLIKDNHGETDSSKTEVKIITLNNPPSEPEVDGPDNGTIDKEYTFRFVSIDGDGDDIRYFIEWGDGTEKETDYISSGEEVEFSHSYDSYRSYYIRVNSEDVKGAPSPPTSHKISILPLSEDESETNNKNEESKSGFPIWVIIIFVIFAVAIILGIILIKKKGIKIPRIKKSKKDNQTLDAKDGEILEDESWDTKDAEPIETWE